MKATAPAWNNLKPNYASIISLNIQMIHNLEAEVVINVIFVIFTLREIKSVIH